VPTSVAPPGYVASVRPRLAARFRDRPDLDLLTFTLIAK